MVKCLYFHCKQLIRFWAFITYIRKIQKVRKTLSLGKSWIVVAKISYFLARKFILISCIFVPSFSDLVQTVSKIFLKPTLSLKKSLFFLSNLFPESWINFQPTCQYEKLMFKFEEIAPGGSLVGDLSCTHVDFWIVHLNRVSAVNQLGYEENPL